MGGYQVLNFHHVHDFTARVLVLVFVLAPQFVEVRHMTDHVTSSTGSTAKLSCSAVGLPAPQIVWYKDGVPLIGENVDEDVFVVDWRDLVKATHQLVLRRLTPADRGQYRCMAFNSHGNVSFTYNLHVIGQSFAQPWRGVVATALVVSTKLLYV